MNIEKYHCHICGEEYLSRKEAKRCCKDKIKKSKKQKEDLEEEKENGYKQYCYGV